MSTTISMPQLGETVTEGTVLRWMKQVGDPIAADEPLVEISTDKVDTEIPSPVAGVVTSILVAEGETIGVGTAMVVIDGESGAPAEPAGGAPVQEPPSGPPCPACWMPPASTGSTPPRSRGPAGMDGSPATMFSRT